MVFLRLKRLLYIPENKVKFPQEYSLWSRFDFGLFGINGNLSDATVDIKKNMWLTLISPCQVLLEAWITRFEGPVSE